MIGDPKTILPTGAPNLALKLSDRQNDYFCGAIVSRACFPTLVSAPFSDSAQQWWFLTLVSVA
jgi:hypothetical protein